jgi:hypothetical protein
MSERVFPTQRVQELETPAAWVEAHRRYYTNLVRHPESGDFLVLNPTTMDLEAPVLRLSAKAFKGKLTTLDPAKVKSADQWLTEYSKMYSNLLFRPSDHKMLVLNPATLDVRAPVAEFQQVGAGEDALVNVNSADEELRARGEVHLEALRAERQKTADDLSRTFRETEQTLLETVAEWRHADTETRDTKALQHRIGQLQVTLARLDDERRQARYPRRYITNMSIPRLMTQPETRDESKMEIFRTVHMTLDPSDRIIGEDMA